MAELLIEFALVCRYVQMITTLPAAELKESGASNRMALRPTSTTRVADVDKFLISTSAYLYA